MAQAARSCAARIGQAVRNFIAQTRHDLEAHPERRAKPAHMLEALIAARHERDSGFSNDNVIGHAVTMVFAGEDTNSNTIAWLLYFVAQHSPVRPPLPAKTTRYWACSESCGISMD